MSRFVTSVGWEWMGENIKKEITGTCTILKINIYFIIEEKQWHAVFQLLEENQVS